MANVLTGMRILCGLLIPFFPVFSGWFFFLYLLGGFTDAIDGTVARKTGKESDFGAKFDTVADFVFTVAVAFKIVQELLIPSWMMIWIAAIALVKIGFHLTGYLKNHEFRTVHSVLNKVCGAVVFTVPLFMGLGLAAWLKAAFVIGICILASISAIAEGIAIIHN